MTKLLIIDDDEISARFFGEMLTKLGYDVVAMGSAVEAIKVLNDIAPDLILMDLQMPDMTGDEATADIKRNDALPDVPIVILSAHSEADAFDDIQRSGADGYIYKRADPETLKSNIDKIIAEYRPGRP